MVFGLRTQTTRLNDLSLICLVCEKQTSFHIHKEMTQAIFIIVPFWSTDYLATCSVCQNMFKLNKKKFVKQLKNDSKGEWLLNNKTPSLEEYIDSKDYKNFLDNDGIKL